MLIGLICASVVLAVGMAAQRVLRMDVTLAPLVGLPCVAVVSTWCAILGAPPPTNGVLVVALALIGLLLSASRAVPAFRAVWRVCRWPAIAIVVATLLPVVVLGAPFAGLEAPVSTHDGAFHTETIDALRRGTFVSTWYPVGFHATVASVLGLFPWLDSARGTLEAAQGLAVLAPIAVVCFALALGADGLAAGLAGIVLSLTWTYPYDYHLWSGWPQGMGVLLLIGLWSAGVRWLARPSLGTAAVAGVCAAAIVLSHGTEVYSGALGLLVLALMRVRQIKPTVLARHAPLAAALALVLIGPYLVTLLLWARAGGATSVGASVVESFSTASAGDRADLLQFVLGILGASSLLDLPARVALIALGSRVKPLRPALAIWIVVSALLFAVDFLDLSIVRTVFVVTYPWLADDRPRQLAVVCASVLAGGGLWVLVERMRDLRTRWTAHPHAWRRLSTALILVGLFFAEGSGVSVVKRIAAGVQEQNVVSADDMAALDWLRTHAEPGAIVANDGFRDAGIWAPYKAGVPILLRRSGARDDAERQDLLRGIDHLSSDPDARATACRLNVGYVYRGASPRDWDPPLLADREVLRASTDLSEVVARPGASVFQVVTPCTPPRG